MQMKSEKRQMTEWIELPNQEKSEGSEKRKLANAWVILEADTIKQTETK